MQSTIGIFDSGIGGLSVLRHIHAQLPHENLVYLADQAHVPYGSRSADDIRHFSQAITRFLLTVGQANVIVVACHTASAAALVYVRQQFPQVPIVGMEPAVKPAAKATKQGKVGVLATPGTFASERYASLMARFAQNVEVFEEPCFGLVPQIEAGKIATDETEQLLRSYLKPMLAAGIDTLVLGCTHYPFVQPLIKQIVGPEVIIIDPAPAIARQTKHILQREQSLTSNRQPREVQLMTTAMPQPFAHLAHRLLSFPFILQTAVWQDDVLCAV